MANKNDIFQQLISGFTVVLETEEGQFEGIFKEIEEGSEGKEMQLVKCLHMGKELPGVQSFALSSIERLESPSISIDSNIKEIENIEVNESKCKHNNGNGIDENVPPKQKSRSKVKDRPVICKVRKKNIADISHLNNLHLLRIPELLEQVQLEDPAPINPSNDIPGAFCIPQPEQDPDHMEGDKYKNKHSLEFTAVRNQTWKETNVPPNVHFPELMFVIKDVQDAMFSKAVQHLHKTRTIGVSLEGQFLGRHGKLSVISFATPEIVYMFDVVSLGSCCFDLGLRQILEDSDIQKGILKIT